MLNSNETNISPLFQFSKFYSNIHGWLSVMVCSIGTLINAINILLVRKTKMANNSTYFILTLIAILDSLVMLMYIPFSIHYYVLFENTNGLLPERDSLFWTMYSIANTYISVTFHSASIWSTIYLAFFRFIKMKESIFGIEKHNKENPTYKIIINHLVLNSKAYLILIVLFCFIICSPVFLVTMVKHEVYFDDLAAINNRTNRSHLNVYFISQSDLNRSTNELFFKLSFYFQAIFIRIIPCILLIIFIFLIIKTMSKITENKKQLQEPFSKVGFFQFQNLN